MRRRIKALGQALSLNHHDQGMLLGFAFLCLCLRAWIALAGLVLYRIMNARYGGGSTFQSPLQSEPSPPAAWADLLYVAIGLIGLLLLVAEGVLRFT